MTDTASRLLELLSLLQARRDWAGGELADRLGVSGRTVRRDVGRLRELGYPVESLSGPTGGYRLVAGTSMPPLLLDEDEAIAIAVGLRTAARSFVTGMEEASVRALVKLEHVLPARLRRRVRDLGAVMIVPTSTGETVDPRDLTVIAAACRDHERLRFSYRRRDGAESRREVEPHALVHLGRRWYLPAWDLGRRDWRTFRVDRMDRLAPTRVRFQPRDLPAADAAEFVQQSISDAPSRHQARVILHASATEIERRLPGRWGTVVPLDDASCELRIGDDDVEWLAMRIVMLGVDFEVEEPPELIEVLRVFTDRLRRATRTATAGP